MEVFVAGVAIAITLFVLTLSSAIGPLTPLVTPGEARVDVPPGEDGRTIYVQVGGSPLEPEEPLQVTSTDLRCEVASAAGGPVAVLSTGGFNLTRGNNRYTSVLQFSNPRPGAYRVSCRDVRDPDRRVPLAIGPKVGVFGFIGGIFGMFIAFLAGGFVALLIVVITAVMRYRDRRRLEREALAAEATGTGAEAS